AAARRVPTMLRYLLPLLAAGAVAVAQSHAPERGSMLSGSRPAAARRFMDTPASTRAASPPVDLTRPGSGQTIRSSIVTCTRIQPTPVEFVATSFLDSPKVAGHYSADQKTQRRKGPRLWNRSCDESENTTILAAVHTNN